MGNTVLALMITALGFGSCKRDSNSPLNNLKEKVDSVMEPEDVYGPPPEYINIEAE